MRGYFEIGIVDGKTPDNLGTLWRSAYQLGASGIFTINSRWPNKKDPCDTTRAWRHIPLRRYDSFDQLVQSLPLECALVGVEMGGKPLETFNHPERACYLLGAEDHGLPEEVLERCEQVVSLPSVRSQSFNVSVAGSIVMYDRLTKSSGRE